MDQLNQAQKWELFLNDLHYALSNRLVQQQKHQYTVKTDKLIELTSNPNRTSEGVSAVLRDFLGIFANHFSRRKYLHYENIQDINLDADKLGQLDRLVRATLKTEPTFEKIKRNKLRVWGQIILCSTVGEYIKRNPEIESVEIFALDKVLMDEDLDASDRKIQLSIISPIWEVEKDVTIKLNGKDAADHRDGAGSLDPPGSPGNDGEPGKPGGNAGTFLGIGKRCVRCNELKILANGGKGGRGQDGGDGKNGKDGKKPRTQISHFYCEKYQEEWKKDGLYPKCGEQYRSGWSTRRDCEVDGGGRPGGHGGKGGNGGAGGKAGSANLLMHLHGDAKIENVKGAGGQSGVGGKGGVGGWKEELKVTLDSSYVSFGISGGGSWKCSEYNNKATSEKFPPGEPGNPGVQTEDSEENASLKIKYASNPSFAVNDYKNYLRRNLKTPVIGATLQRFLDYLETNNEITGLYDTLGLVKDFLNLENQSRGLLNQGIPLVPFYQQLLDRIDKYQIQQHETQDAEEYRMVLSYLYRSALSKIHSINSNANNDLVVDVRKNLAYVSKNIEEWKNFKNLVEKNKTRNKYKEGIQRKIEEANAFIENDITKDIENNIENTNKQLNNLFAEVVEQEKTKQKEEQALEEQREKLKRQMALRAVLGVVQIASQALTFAGPVGAAAGAAIGGVTTVVENLATSDTTAVAVTALPGAVTTTLNKLNEAYKQKHELFKKQLNKANAKMEEFLDDKNVKTEASKAKEKVKEIQVEMKVTKNKLDELMKRATIEDPASVNEMYDLRKKIDGLLKDGKEQIGKIGGADKYKNALEKVQNIVGLAKMGVDLYSKVQGDFDKITAVDKSIATVNEQLNKLDKFEQSIYTTMAPLIERIKKSIESAETSEGKSHAALDVTKWQVQGAIREVRREMQQMTAGFKSGDEITFYIDKLEYGMSMMIQMYDRIQSYTDQGDLVDVITNVDSSTDISNNELYTAMSELKLKISSNIISEYESTMKAVLLHVFPYATDYMKPLTMPERFSLNGTDQLVDNLKTVEKTLLREQSTIQTRDSNIISNVTFAESSNLPPFFIWKHNKNRGSVEKLLQGESVELKAEISKSDCKENAVKFNDISIRFKSNELQLQNELNEALAKYSIEMTHLGDSEYRCSDKFYTVPHEKQIIQRSVLNDGGLENGVYAKINNNEPVLSPFATWALSLKSADADFASISKFIGKEMDLVLEGHGNFVRKDEAACNDDLSKYYTPKDDSQGRFIDEEYEDYEEQEELEGPGPVTYLASAISNAVQYLNPVNQITQWVSGKPAEPSKIEFLSALPSLNEYQHQRLITANPEGESITSNAINYNSAGAPANLPLFELMIRKINGSKRQERSATPNQEDQESAQNLAYNAYAPK